MILPCVAFWVPFLRVVVPEVDITAHWINHLTVVINWLRAKPFEYWDFQVLVEDIEVLVGSESGKDALQTRCQ